MGSEKSGATIKLNCWPIFFPGISGIVRGNADVQFGQLWLRSCGLIRMRRSGLPPSFRRRRVPLSQIPAQCFSSSVSVPHVDDVAILDTTARLEKVEFRSGSRSVTKLAQRIGTNK